MLFSPLECKKREVRSFVVFPVRSLVPRTISAHSRWLINLLMEWTSKFSMRLYYSGDSNDRPTHTSHRIPLVFFFCARYQNGKIFVKDLENHTLVWIWILREQSHWLSGLPEAERVINVPSANMTLHPAGLLALGKVKPGGSNSSSANLWPEPLIIKRQLF